MEELCGAAGTADQGTGFLAARCVDIADEDVPAALGRRLRGLNPRADIVEAVAAATLLIYSIWLAHDHLDSPVLAKLRLPKKPKRVMLNANHDVLAAENVVKAM